MNINFDELEKGISNPKGNSTKALQALLKQSAINQAKIESSITLFSLILEELAPNKFKKLIMKETTEEFITERANEIISAINAKIID